MNILPVTILLYFLLGMGLCSVISLSGLIALITVFILKHSPGYEKGRARNKFFVIISVITSMLMFGSFGFGLKLLQGLLVMFLCIYACMSDIEERQLTNWASLLLFAFGFIGKTGNEIFSHSIAGLCMFGFLFLCAVISNNRLGGADIKFASAFTFVLGLQRAIPALMLGLLASVVGTPIRNRIQKSTIKTKKEKQTMALVPYLAAGFLCMFIL